MTTNAATRLAVGRVIYSQPGPSVRRSQNRRRHRRLLAVLFVLITLAALYMAGHAEGAAKDPCRSERTAWRKAQHTLVIGGQRPGDYWTTQAALLQCQREYKER